MPDPAACQRVILERQDAVDEDREEADRVRDEFRDIARLIHVQLANAAKIVLVPFLIDFANGRSGCRRKQSVRVLVEIMLILFAPYSKV